MEQFAPGVVVMVRVASVNGAAGEVTEMRVMSRSAARAGLSGRLTRERVRLNARS